MRGRSALRRRARPVVLALARGVALVLAALAAPAAASPPPPAAVPGADALVILVATDSPVTRLDRETVRHLFLGRIPTLHAIPGVRDGAPDDTGGDARIRLFLAADAEEAFTRSFLDLSPRRFRKRWVKSLLSGAATHGPETVTGAARAAELVAEDVGAFGVCRPGPLPDGVRPLEIVSPPSPSIAVGR